MELEPELKAMNDIYTALEDLPDDARQRVLNWAISKFALRKRKPGGETEGSQRESSAEEFFDIASFGTVADIFGRVRPKSEADKVLVVGAYLQKNKKNGSDLTGHEISKTLKHLGHPIQNITHTISSLISRNPSLMMQIRKEGKTKQAKKKYMVTNEGFTAVQTMIRPSNDSEV